MHSKTGKQGELQHKLATLFLIWLTSLAMIKQRSKRRSKKELFITVKNIVLPKTWFVVSNFWEFPKDDTEKWCSCHLHFLLKTKVKFTTFRRYLVTKYLRQVNQCHFSYKNYFSIFVLRWDVFKLIKNPFIKIKKQLMLTNFTLVMYKITEKY